MVIQNAVNYNEFITNYSDF